MAGKLEGRTAIVTGAGGGVGLAIARRFAEEGATLLVTDRDEDALDHEASALADGGATVHRWCCNLREKLGVSNLLASAMDRMGRVDILVNANLTTVQGAPMEVDATALDAAYEANVRSVFMLTQAVARNMIETRAANPELPAGAVVNVTSISAQRTAPQLLPYSVSCAALDQLTRAMAVALAPQRVRVNGVALGAVMTKSLAAALREVDGMREALIRATPMGRIGEADEAAEAALFLASAKASFVTGQIIAVDGGRTVLDPLAAPTQ
ncbi:MAG: SDR family NAD(P)-dependent oxidoreductase [Rubrimonas sp.]